MLQFLIVNELPMRGDSDLDGLFQKLFHLAVTKDDRLRSIFSQIPKNAKYTSPEIQNEIIECMADITTNTIVKDLASSPCFAIMADETRDKQGVEDLAIGCRFVPSGSSCVVERCIAVSALSEQNAVAITESIFHVLEDLKIDHNKLIAQSYDGASVMAGAHGGVQALISQKLGKDISYIHCLNHQIHLAVVGTLASHKDVRQYLERCEELYKFFRRQQVANIYTGDTLKRLMQHRWSGHLATIEIIIENKAEIESALTKLSESEGPSSRDIMILASGFLAQISKAQFHFLSHFLYKLLMLLEPITKQLQSPKMNIKRALDLINAVWCNIEDMRTDKKTERIVGFAAIIDEIEIPEEKTDAINVAAASSKTKCSRKRKVPPKMDDYVTVDHGYEYAAAATAPAPAPVVASPTIRQQTHQDKFTPMYFAVIDTMLMEFKERFSERNLQLIGAVNHMLNAERKIDDLAPLMNLTASLQPGVNMQSLLKLELFLANQLLGEVCVLFV
jgi:hypothetical protein